MILVLLQLYAERFHLLAFLYKISSTQIPKVFSESNIWANHEQVRF
jgi:hypothetical protein